MTAEQQSEESNMSQYLECELSNCLGTWEAVDSASFFFFDSAS